MVLCNFNKKFSIDFLVVFELKNSALTRIKYFKLAYNKAS